MTAQLLARRRRGLFGLFVSALLLVATIVAPAAFAQEEGASSAAPELLMVDATGEPFLVVRTPTRPSQIDVSIEGIPVQTSSPITVADSSLNVQTVIVIDNSAESAEFLDSLTAAASDYVRRAPASEQISVWTTGGSPRLRVGLNSEHDRTREIVDNIVGASGSNQLWDAVRGGALSFVDSVPGATNMIVFTGNIDAGSTSSAAESRGSVLSTNASAFLVTGAETVSASEARFVDVTPGGAYAETGVLDEIAGYGASISQVVASTWAVAFSSDTVDAGTNLSIQIDDATIDATFSDGAVTSGRALAPITPPGSSTLPGLGFLEGETGRSVGLILGAVAAALGAFSITMLFQKDSSGLNDMLMAYSEPTSVPGAADEQKGSFARNVFMKRAVEITEGLAERRGTLQKSEALLERANLPLRAGEALTAYAGIVLGSLALGLILVGGLAGVLVFGVLGLLIPPGFVRFQAGRRTKKFMGQLPDTLQLLSSTLKAGYSFMQGVEAVSHEIEDPMGGELRRIVTEAQLGRPLEDAMDASAERMESDDFAWAVMAVKIQREVGGNLSELLLTVAETMTERERLRRDVAALTAEGKMSAIVLGVLPILLGGAMWALNPEYINTLFSDSLGQILLGSSIVAALAGFAWMKKIISIEI